MAEFRRVAAFKTAQDFLRYAEAQDAHLPFDEELEQGAAAALAQRYQLGDQTIGNRFAVLPMEGWDGTTNGWPTDLVRRRWQRFGESGAKLIWGCEAVAVRPDGRANPNQLMILPETVGALAETRELLVRAHEARYGCSDDLLVGLQLTHSGRFARPHTKTLEPAILYHHPLLDRRFHLPPDSPVLSDEEIDRLIDDFIVAAQRAQQAGFAFVDLKHCHGYLGHEFLSAVDRAGRYGGSFENRTRFLRNLVDGIRNAAPGLGLAVRLSAFDFVAFQPGSDRRGAPTPFEGDGYRYAFGCDESGLRIDLTEPLAFLDLLDELGIKLVCITAGSPYYNPHIQRPAFFPPSDGYQPPEDPLVGVARQIGVVAELKRQRPNLVYVGSGYSYLQEWFPNVAQAAVRTGQTDFVGIGRMVLSYPDICADILAGKAVQRKRLCRTFSDCTTGPRNGLISGCYPLDDFYKGRPEFAELQRIKGEA